MSESKMHSWYFLFKSYHQVNHLRSTSPESSSLRGVDAFFSALVSPAEKIAEEKSVCFLQASGKSVMVRTWTICWCLMQNSYIFGTWYNQKLTKFQPGCGSMTFIYCFILYIIDKTWVHDDSACSNTDTLAYSWITYRYIYILRSMVHQEYEQSTVFICSGPRSCGLA